MAEFFVKALVRKEFYDCRLIVITLILTKDRVCLHGFLTEFTLNPLQRYWLKIILITLAYSGRFPRIPRFRRSISYHFKWNLSSHWWFIIPLALGDELVKTCYTIIERQKLLRWRTRIETARTWIAGGSRMAGDGMVLSVSKVWDRHSVVL